MSMGNRIAEQRKQKNFSQEYIAEKLEISRQAVSKWEQDLSKPDTSNLIKLAELFNVSVEYLTVGKDAVGDNGNAKSEGPKKKPYLVLLIVVCAVIHFMCGIMGRVNVVAVITVPVLCAFISLIMYAAFSSMTKSGNYDMLAGYDKSKANIEVTQLQMHWIELLSEISSLLFETIFVLIYFVPTTEQMNMSVVLFIAYISVLAICVVTVNLKVKPQ